MNRAWNEFLNRLSGALDEAADQNRRRALRPLGRLPGGRVSLPDGRVLIDVSSNDYLGLALHPQVRARAAEYAERLGGSAPASRLVSGTLPEHLQVEQRLAAFKRADGRFERITVRSRGANISVLTGKFSVRIALEGRRSVQRKADRSSGWIHRAAGVDA